MSKIAHYTRVVFLWKILLILLVAAIVSALIWVSNSGNSENGGRMVFTNVIKGVMPPNVMEKPFYQGVDVHNRPYSVAADTGMQKDPNTVELEKISAEMTDDNGKWMSLNAGHGVLHLPSKHLQLSGGVEVFYGDGYNFRTQDAFVDINKGEAKSDSKIEGQGRGGSLTASSFQIVDRGSVLRFKGSVRLLLYH